MSAELQFIQEIIDNPSSDCKALKLIAIMMTEGIAVKSGDSSKAGLTLSFLSHVNMDKETEFERFLCNHLLEQYKKTINRSSCC